MTTPVHCDACGSTLLDDAVFCHGCGVPIPGARPASERARTGVTVLSIDALGSIACDERLDAAQWQEVVDGLFAVVSTTIQRHGGTIGRLAGDGIEVVFGAPTALESHATLACHAALRIRDHLHELAASVSERPGVRLSARIGLASGDVLLAPRSGGGSGALARSPRADAEATPAHASALASQANLAAIAARVRQLAGPGEIRLCEQTAHLIDDTFSLRDAGALAPRGGQRRTRTFTLVAARAVRPTHEPARAGGRGPLLGRERELAELEHALQDTARRGMRVVGLVGDAGVGKTRLAEELVARQRARGVPVHVTRCAEHSRWTPFHTTIPFLRGAFGLRRDDDPATVRTRITDVLDDVDPTLLDTVPLLATAFGIADAAEAARATAGRSPARDIARVLRAMLERYRPTAPSLFVVDDHHWMDPGADAVFDELVRARPQVPLLLLVTYRPGHDRPWMRGPNFRELSLRPLDAARTLDLARMRMGDDRSLHRLQDRLAEHAAGNPLFVAEAVLALAASGALEGAPHAYRLRADTTPSLPQGIDELLAGRIAGLAARDRTVLQAAAVIGRAFPVALVARVTRLAPDEVAASLRSLEHAELVSASDAGDEPVHLFRHALQQRVAYGSLAPDERTELHRRIATDLTRPYGTRGNPHAGRIAVHCEAAGDLLDAARWHRRAASQIVGWDPAQSYVHWRSVLSCSGRLAGDEAARLRLSACEAVLRLGFHHGLAPAEAEALAAEGQEIARRLGDVRMQALLASALGSLRGSTGDLDAGMVHQRTALQHAERTGEAGLALMTGAQLLFSHRVAGRTVEGLRLADALLERHRPDDVRSLGADFVWLRQLELGRAMLLVDRGRLDEGGAELTRVLALLRDEEAPVAYAWALSLTAAVVRFAGDPTAVLAARIEEAYERARRCAVPSLVGRALSSLATLRLCQNRWEEARRYAEQADATMRELGHTFYVDFDPRLMLSYARFGLGDIAGARAAAYEALEHAFRSGARLGQIDTMAALARLLVRYGTLEQIAQGHGFLRHGLALIRRCRARSREPFFWLELAGLERRAGNEARALACQRRGVRQLLAMNAYGHLPRAAGMHAIPPEHAGLRERPPR